MTLEKIESLGITETAPASVIKTPYLKKSVIQSLDPVLEGDRGVITNELRTGEENNGSYSHTTPNIPIEIVLEKIWTATESEGRFRGSTGEFYWLAVVSDGDEVVVQNSKSTGFGGEDGVLTGVDGKSWLPVDKVLLYRTPVDYEAGVSYPRSVSFGFRLIERDDEDEATRILNGLSPIAQAAVTAYTGNPEAAVYTDMAVKFVNGLLSLDSDDLVINGVRGLLGVAQHFRVGKFITIRTGNSVAGFSINPVNDHGDDFARYEINLPPQSSSSDSFTIEKAGQLSFLFRAVYYAFLGSQFRPVIKLVNSNTGEVLFEKRLGRRAMSSYNWSVEPGTYHFESFAPFGGRFSMMYAAYKPDLAIQESLNVSPAIIGG